jgi:Protein of unknown function (DUF2798)
MTVVMTGGMLYVHSGYCQDFFKLWAKDFTVGCLIAIPTGLLVVPIISKWVDRHTGNKNTINIFAKRDNGIYTSLSIFTQS